VPSSRARPSVGIRLHVHIAHHPHRTDGRSAMGGQTHRSRETAGSAPVPTESPTGRAPARQSTHEPVARTCAAPARRASAAREGAVGFRGALGAGPAREQASRAYVRGGRSSSKGHLGACDGRSDVAQHEQRAGTRGRRRHGWRVAVARGGASIFAALPFVRRAGSRRGRSKPSGALDAAAFFRALAGAWGRVRAREQEQEQRGNRHESAEEEGGAGGGHDLPMMPSNASAEWPPPAAPLLPREHAAVGRGQVRCAKRVDGRSSRAIGGQNIRSGQDSRMIRSALPLRVR
jgi:hypothetical protein